MALLSGLKKKILLLTPAGKTTVSKEEEYKVMIDSNGYVVKKGKDLFRMDKIVVPNEGLGNAISAMTQELEIHSYMMSQRRKIFLYTLITELRGINKLPHPIFDSEVSYNVSPNKVNFKQLSNKGKIRNPLFDNKQTIRAIRDELQTRFLDDVYFEKKDVEATLEEAKIPSAIKLYHHLNFV